MYTMVTIVNMKLLNFQLVNVLLILGISFAISFIATFLPVKKIASMKPIDAIKNRK